MRTLLAGSALLLLLLSVACDATPPLDDRQPIGEQKQELGEPQGGFPNYDERALHYLTNRVRIDPKKATEIGCPRNFDVPAKQPVDYDLTLSWAARFQSKVLVKAPCFQHGTCCYIQGTGLNAYCCDQTNGAGCSAGAEKYSCASCGGGQNCPGTSFGDRIAGAFGYGGQAFGENIAMGHATALDAFCAFFDEGPDADDGIEHGHFLSIMSAPDRFGNPTPDWNEIGTGFFESGGCSTGGGTMPGRGYTQDFGLRAGIVRNAIPSALHRPEFGTSVTIGAIWNHPKAPKLLHAVIDGVCTPLPLVAGPGPVGVYEAKVNLTAGCHRYYVFAQDDTGKVVTYPDVGSLQVGTTATACASEYTATRLSAACCNAQVSCPNAGSCNGGTCGSVCVPGGACALNDGCQNGTTTCPGGNATCSNVVNAADGTSCGADRVCRAGTCAACVSGAGCPDPANPCRAGTTSCATGTQLCGNVQALPDGTSCGTGMSCLSGACIACEPGAACVDPANPCRTGTVGCATGSAVCTGLQNAPDGTACGSGEMCFNGVCSTCAPGTACTDPSNPCRLGTIDCSSGAAVCTNVAVAADGTACGTGEFCASGTCGPCNENDRCSSPTDPCQQGTISCSTGRPVCSGLNTAANGASCGADHVCNAGVCVACASGASCFGTNACRQGTIDCSTGAPQCTNFQSLPNGASCGTGMSCLNGNCIACDHGASCPGPSACQKGTLDCSTGSAQCTNIGPAPDGTACAAGSVCSSGACVGCNAGAACSDGNVCHTATLDCSTGTAVCSNVQDKPNGTVCGTNQVCRDGTCTVCEAGVACTQGDGCSAGTISCATGAPVCANLNVSPDGTVCGSGKVCRSGACVDCIAGKTCLTPDGCQVGTTECATGTQVCVGSQNRPDGSSCGTDRVCRSGQCQSCVANALCNPNGNPCQQGISSCSTGALVCSNPQNLSNGAPCGQDKVCLNGACQACSEGAPCVDPSDPCLEGTVSCTTGAPLCDNLTPRANGSSCGTDKVCSNGTCLACQQGARCTDPSRVCEEGTISCTTGAPVCVNFGDAPDGTTCGANGICIGGSCNVCTAGTSCHPSGNLCQSGTIACVSGQPTCSGLQNEPNGKSCGLNQVCNAGACVACTTGETCAHPSDPCQAGKIACGTGAPVCGSFERAPDGSACGTNKVCSAGACVSCTEGAACVNPADACQLGKVSCGSGSPVCGSYETAPDGTVCGAGKSCSAGACTANEVDAGVPDAGAETDAGIEADAGEQADAGTAVGDDAGEQPGADAGSSPPDASGDDAGAADAGAPGADDAGGTLPSNPDDGANAPAGCGCGATGGAPGAAPLLLLGLLRRRFQRRAS